MSPSFKSVVVPLSEVPFESQEEEAVAFDESREAIVLIVDDERMVADTLGLIFKRAGFCALTAYDAKGALEIAGAIAPDVLVSDVDMPGMNGVSLAMTLLETLPQCKVLLFSGHATLADLAGAQEAGHDFPLLSKPVHPAVMIESVSKCLGGRPAAAKRLMPELVHTSNWRQST